MVVMDTDRTGLEMFFRQRYKAIVIGWYFEDSEEWKSTGDAWRYVNEQIAPLTISRSSVINFLNLCVVDGYLEKDQVVWRGGMAEIYRAKMDTNGFWHSVLEIINDKLAPFVKGPV